MRDIQLYLGNDRLELFGGDSINITDSIKNAKDPAKIFTTFSQQFVIPASKTNNRIFKHYYNYNIQGDNSFDARTKKDARLEINHIPFKTGKLKLDGVDLRNNKPYSYRVTFYGSVVELKDVLGEDKLPSLETALDIDPKGYSASDIKTALTSGPDADGCLIPLITTSQRLYYDSANNSTQSGNLYYDSVGATEQGVKSTELKYAIKLTKLIDAIEEKYDQITFATDSFIKANSGTDFSKLYMWCHRKKGTLEITSGGNYSYGFASGDGVSNGYYEVQAQTGYSVREIDIVVSIDSATINARYDLILTVNDVVHDRYDGLTGDQTLTVELRDNFNDGDLVKIFIDTYENNVNFTIITMNVTYFQETQGGTLDYTESASTIVYNIPASFKFNVAKNLPEMKIIDFLSAVFKMFNLVAYVQTNGSIEVQPLDDFYGSTERDITKYVDVSSSQVNVAIPYKEIFFKYKDTGTILAEQHFQEIAQVDANGRGPFEWGGVEYTATDTNLVSGGTYKVEPEFHHAKYEKLFDLFNNSDTGIQVGYFVDDNSESYLGSPLIMYVNTDVSPNVDLSFLTSGGAQSITTSSTINMPSNLEDIDTATSANIHFNPEISEYTAGASVEADNTLFLRYYKKYIENLFNKQTRLIKISCILPVNVLIQIQLSDVILLSGQKYRINSYNTNLITGRTEFELINYYD